MQASPEGHISITGVSKYFGRHKALDNVSLEIPPGSVTVILGPSGSGKSTLLRTINHLERVDEGFIQIDGDYIGYRRQGDKLYELKEKEILKQRVNVGYVFQNFNLFPHLTVLENLIEAPIAHKKLSKKEAVERAYSLLDVVGLRDKADAWSRHLSGGQQQRIAIARALASNPKVLLCDEATSALDPATTRSILELLKDINRRLGLTILLITHEMDVVKRICDCVAVISNGELIEQDTVSEVFSHPKTPLAQQFIQSTLHLDIPEDYLERLKTEATADSVPMLRMEFTGQSVDAPLLSETARRFNVNNNIISAQMDYAGGVKFGIMLTEMHGTQEETQAAIAWLQEHHVKVEVLGYV